MVPLLVFTIKPGRLITDFKIEQGERQRDIDKERSFTSVSKWWPYYKFLER